jgi:DNA-binding CsgD family transcriptional regulator
VLNAVTMPPALHDAPLAQLAFQVSAGCVLIFHAVRYLFGPAIVSEDPVPRGFLARYGISGREREIINLMINGLSNRDIGEKLFISAQTVKNHVYNIYRKTRVENKVQLLNLIQKNAIR